MEALNGGLEQFLMKAYKRHFLIEQYKLYIYFSNGQLADYKVMA